jgi:hypothetical protein
MKKAPFKIRLPGSCFQQASIKAIVPILAKQLTCREVGKAFNKAAYVAVSKSENGIALAAS